MVKFLLVVIGVGCRFFWFLYVDVEKLEKLLEDTWTAAMTLPEPEQI